MKRWKVLSLLLCLSLLGSGCSKKQHSSKESNVKPTQQTNNQTQDEKEEENQEQAESEEAESKSSKQVVVYFANWYLDGKDAMDGGEVASIPWDSVTYVNHAFWAVSPADGTTETSFEREMLGMKQELTLRLSQPVQ